MQELARTIVFNQTIQIILQTAKGRLSKSKQAEIVFWPGF